jgi:hypothetical protein
MSDPLMVVEGSAFGHSDLISITRNYLINSAITYKAHDFPDICLQDIERRGRS